LTFDQHNIIVVFVIPEFEDSGNLPPGVYVASWREVETRFGTDSYRQESLMIRNGRQYKITHTQAENFRNALEQLRHERVNDSTSAEYLRWKAQYDAIESQLRDLEEDLREYESLQGSDSTTIEINSFEDLPKALIQARIAAGLTQKQLAEKLGIKEQQIQRYEACDYAGVGLDRIQDICKALGISVKSSLSLRT
jgi:ribosome-binding protein aMBF1 (putative translation factor)